jgi:hypothetical protein
LGVGGPNCPSCGTNGNNCPPSPDFTYYEYTLNKQAREWFPLLDIKSMCNEHGVFDGSIPPIGYMLTYNPITGTWSWQQHPFVLCTPAPEFKTFIPRSEYQKENDPTGGTIEIPVVSPKVPIELQTNK